MKVSELKRLLKKNKSRFYRHGGRHDIWFSEITGKSFPVPRHDSKEVPTGTLKSILQDAGIE